MKKTPLHDLHVSLNARMVDFGGWDMPINYGSQIDEHHIIRKDAGMFDVSHMGEFWAKGPNAFELLQRITTNDLSTLTVGKAQYTCFPNESGGVISLRRAAPSHHESLPGRVSSASPLPPALGSAASGSE